MSNHLATESSPYLRQHADNPVNWYPWGADAFAEAKERDCPVIISIGYAACHWCHVMAHESFENPEIAAVMNEGFVCIKVDREERPDIDAVYMEATQAMVGSGGWPMTVFATPDGNPFFCGTYFPPRTSQGRIGFPELCHTLSAAWVDQRDKVIEQAAEITKHVQREGLDAAEMPSMSDVDNAVANLVALHDQRWGGFGPAPKFPQPMVIDVVLGAFQRTADEAALVAAVTTLDAMAAGGIYDHLGGGFARYSVDNIWLVPHFEKMLSDQALLIRAYTHAWQTVGLDRHRTVVAETVEYVLRDLRHESGGFFSSEDADADGMEGSFQVWSPAEIRAALADDPDAAEAAIAWWGVTEAGNFEGQSILHRLDHRTGPARSEDVDRARSRLFAARDKRVRPGLDDKVLTEWNALMISALAEAAVAMEEPAWLHAAETAAKFLIGELHDGQRGWLRSWQSRSGARHQAFASDHAALVDAFTRLYEATGDAAWLSRATTTAESLLENFEDPVNGGFFTTSHTGEQLVANLKALQDNPIPSANSSAAVALLRLGALTGEGRYRESAGRVLSLTGRFAGQHPTAFGELLAAIPLYVHGVTEVTISGADTAALLTAYRATWRPEAVLRIEASSGDAQAMVCRNSVCDLPVTAAADLTRSLDG